MKEEMYNAAAMNILRAPNKMTHAGSSAMRKFVRSVHPEGSTIVTLPSGEKLNTRSLSSSALNHRIRSNKLDMVQNPSHVLPGMETSNCPSVPFTLSTKLDGHQTVSTIELLDSSSSEESYLACSTHHTKCTASMSHNFVSPTRTLPAPSNQETLYSSIFNRVKKRVCQQINKPHVPKDDSRAVVSRKRMKQLRTALNQEMSEGRHLTLIQDVISSDDRFEDSDGSIKVEPGMSPDVLECVERFILDDE